MARRRKSIGVRKESLKQLAEEFNEWCIKKYGIATVSKISICFRVHFRQKDKDYQQKVNNGLQIWKDRYDTIAEVPTPRRRKRVVDEAPRRRRRKQ